MGGREQKKTQAEAWVLALSVGEVGVQMEPHLELDGFMVFLHVEVNLEA